MEGSGVIWVLGGFVLIKVVSCFIGLFNDVMARFVCAEFPGARSIGM